MDKGRQKTCTTLIFETTQHKEDIEKIIEIWEESARFKTTSQRHADQAMTIIKKCWLLGIEISKIHQEMNRESSSKDPNTIVEALNSE